MLSNERESVGLKHCDDPISFIKYSLDDVYENIDEDMPMKKSKYCFYLMI